MIGENAKTNLLMAFLIEYFANPARQLYAYMDDGLKDGKRVDATMFVNGEVVFDKTGVTQGLIERANVDLRIGLKGIDAMMN